MLPIQRAGSQKGRVSMRRGNLPPTKDTRDSHAKHGDLWRGIVQRQRQFGKVILRRPLIVFDTNPPIATPEWLNTLDNTKPTSQVFPLASTQGATDFIIE